MEGQRLRAMRVGDILDASFSLYRGNFLRFVGLAAIPYLLFFVLYVAMVFLSLVISRVGGPTSFATMIGMSVSLSIVVVIPIATGALIFAIAERYLGRKATIWQSLRRVRFWSILGASFLITLVIGAILFTARLVGTPLGAFAWLPTLIILPGIAYLLINWGFYCQCITVEGYRAVTSLRRSMELVRGSWWRVFGILLLLIFMVCVFGVIFPQKHKP